MLQTAERETKRADNRLGTLLDVSAELFAAKGYRETTMRDIAAAAEMLPGSIYYHFASKDDLLVAVYREGVRRIEATLTAAVEGEAEPWARLEKAVRAHLHSILAPTAYARVMIRVVPDSIPVVAGDLIALRDTYEAAFAKIVDALPLPIGVDRKLVRFFILGAANHVQIWFRDGPLNVDDVARQLVAMVAGTNGGAKSQGTAS